MSKISKKPAEQDPVKTSNINLLPEILNTEPNQKMLDSTLDLMTSKGQLLPFKSTYGIRSASNRTIDSFALETDEVRRESQANNVLVLSSSSDEYLGKVSYLDIENYFSIKNLPLKDGVVLDKDVNILSLPVQPLKITDYNMYYWLPAGLPPCRIHLEESSPGANKFSIVNDLLTKPFAKLVSDPWPESDDGVYRELELQNGIIVYFTGHTDTEYLTVDETDPKFFFVYGVGTGIQLLSVNNVNYNIPYSKYYKRPWDKSSPYIDPPAINWASEEWDGSRIRFEPEYVVQDKIVADDYNTNHWQALDHWYHINTIRNVATFLGAQLTELASSQNKATRPIISFYRYLKLYDWPTRKISDVKTVLHEDIPYYHSKTEIKDDYGYVVKNGDLVVFDRWNGIYQVNVSPGNNTFSLVTIGVEGDGVQIVSNSAISNYQLMIKNSKWQFAQNKTEKNQTPLYEFYTSDGVALSSLNDTNFTGGVILGFKEGVTFDTVLEKYIDITKIDFEIINENNPSTVSPNRIKFITDVDRSFEYYDTTTNEKLSIVGPYGFDYLGRIFPFYQNRRGLDFTKQMQDLRYESNEIYQWQGEFIPPTNGYTTIHIFYDSTDNFKFYYELDGYGLVEFSSKLSVNTFEQMLPLVQGSINKIICHDLPTKIVFYKEVIEDNISKPVLLSAPYCINNNISNGEILVDLREQIGSAGSYIDNELFSAGRLYWKFYNSFKISLVRPLDAWRFIQSVYIKDNTQPIFYGNDFNIEPAIDSSGNVSYYNVIKLNNNVVKKIIDGDKVVVNAIVNDPISKTAPLGLTTNPLNETLDDINYYSLYQHMTSLKSNISSIRTSLEQEAVGTYMFTGGGTFLKHSNPLARFVVAATNLPYSFDDLLIRQAKHYDLFLVKLKNELENYFETNDSTGFDWYDAITFALNNIYSSTNTNSTMFWSHSNMLGWGEKEDNYVELDIASLTATTVNLDDILFPISHKTGEESILHITYNNRLLTRSVDYTLNSLNGYYTSITFNTEFLGKAINIKQWFVKYYSYVPASLSKIGLSPVYKPEIYEDATNTPYLIRHDGTYYLLKDGIDADGYPTGSVDAMLYEYEKAVWSSIACNVELNYQHELYKNKVGYFRQTHITYLQSSELVNAETRQWALENNIYLMPNDSYDSLNGFTYNYYLGSGDGDVISGSWRAIYKYLYDTDRPHSHPWEMLGYTIKPAWWDTHYSWTNSAKRIKLEKALRTGNVAEPPGIKIDVSFARQQSFTTPETFPVDTSGNLLPPSDLTWLGVSYSNDDWLIGDHGPYEHVFLNSHRGVAAIARSSFLQNPSTYVNINWVPGSTVKNSWGQRIDRSTNTWQAVEISHDYHRKELDGDIVYTGGMESLYVEFSMLYNTDYEVNVIEKFANVAVKKEFLLSGFSNKNSIRIKNTSINSRQLSLLVPDQNYTVKTIKHFPDREYYFSGIRIIYKDSKYYIYGFNNNRGILNYYDPKVGSSTIPITIGDIVINEKIFYDKDVINSVIYGTSFSNRQTVYDLLIGYGKLSEDLGFLYEKAEGGDIKNWQLSAKQFMFWSNDALADGNYIDLNPSADEIIFKNPGGQLENLEGINENIGQCIDRLGRNIFSKDLLVKRTTDLITIKTKDPDRPIYGIKMTFSTYESVIHLDAVSIFNDVYFNPSQSVSKRSFLIGGKKTNGWTGRAQAYGFAFYNNELLPNFDTFADTGRGLLDVESSTIDSTLLDASRSQFGLNRNPELRQLFLEEDKEILFKNAVTFNKGTVGVFDSLNPITHEDGSSTMAYEEYMVRIGELGNILNLEYYEFELTNADLDKDSKVIKFIDKYDIEDNNNIHYVKDNSTKWVYKPYDKNLRFNTYTTNYSSTKISGPILPGDTDLTINTLEDMPSLYDKFYDLWSIPHYSEEKSYKTNDKVRFNGKLYRALTTVSPNTWTNNSDKFSMICEPILPNIFVTNYTKANDTIVNQTPTVFKPGTWQVLQTIDRELGINELCPGPSDISKARITTMTNSDVSVNDWVMVVNSDDDTSSANGIWKVVGVETGRSDQFYIDTRITQTIKRGKVFTFKPIRFKNMEDFVAANYPWKEKICTDEDLSLTPSGYDPKCPIAIVDDGLMSNVGYSYDFGNYKVYCPLTMSVVKEESLSVNPDDIEHLIVYDYESNKTIIKVDLFDPKKMYIPEVFKREIDVTNRVDPARYNRTTDDYKSIYTSSAWYEEYVGRRWWDTGTLSFSDYENGDEITKMKYWGTTVDGKLPDIYEWTRSSVHPSQYNKLVDSKVSINGQLITGEAYVDTSSGTDQYHWCEESDYNNGKETTTYYFWVKNKQEIPKESDAARVYSINQLAKVILNPAAAGLPWWAPISNNSLIVKGIRPYLTGTTVVQIKKKTKGEEKHQQWVFISENNTVELIPEWLHIRFRDSISGHVNYKIIGYFENYSSGKKYKQSDFVKYNNNFYVCKVHMLTSEIESGSGLFFNPLRWQLLTDVFEIRSSLLGTWDGYFWDRRTWDDYDKLKFYYNKLKNVPDTEHLHKYNRYGNVIRPYIQSWFRNLYEARRTFITKLNEILLNVNITALPNWGNTILNNTAYKHSDGSMDITKFWYYADFRSESYSPLKDIASVIDNISDLYTIPSVPGDYIKVNKSYTEYTIYEKNADYSFSIAFEKNGAIQFKKLYDTDEAWDVSIWDNLQTGWDYDINSVYNAIVDSIRREIFLGNYLRYYSVIICSMFRYVLSEQLNVDWIAKSSTIEPLNLIEKKLSTTSVLERDEISAIKNVYSSLKSYRDKLRSGTINKVYTEEATLEINETAMVNMINSDGNTIDLVIPLT